MLLEPKQARPRTGEQTSETDGSGYVYRRACNKGRRFDLKELFVRILEKEDWTDKLAAVLARVRGRIHLPREDTKLSKELRLLVPDMKEVEKAYVEMTSGYKDFIRDVLKASRRRHSLSV